MGFPRPSQSSDFCHAGDDHRNDVGGRIDVVGVGNRTCHRVAAAVLRKLLGEKGRQKLNWIWNSLHCEGWLAVGKCASGFGQGI